MSRIAERYRALVFDHRFEYDPAQAALARKLDALSLKLRDYRAEPKPNAFARLMGLKPAEPPRGLYVFGAVGRGKTMLMDLFFDAVEAAAQAPRAFSRLHGRRARAPVSMASGAEARRDDGR